MEEYVGGPNAEVESVVKQFQETSSKYRYMELSLSQRRKALQTKIPDFEKTLSVVRFLQARRRKALGEAPPAEEADEEDKDGDDSDGLDDLDDEDEGKDEKEGPLKSLFELNETLYAEAEIMETGEVGLWLGVSPSVLLVWRERQKEGGEGLLISLRQTQCCSILCKKPSTYYPRSSRPRRRAWKRQ